VAQVAVSESHVNPEIREEPGKKTENSVSIVPSAALRNRVFRKFAKSSLKIDLAEFILATRAAEPAQASLNKLIDTFRLFRRQRRERGQYQKVQSGERLDQG